MVKKIGNYELESKIGEGNYGIVYLGKNSNTKEVVAGKAIPMKNPNSKLLKQMETEIKVLKSSECPYIIKLHDVLKTQNNIYLIMEFCGGGDLENYVKSHGKVEEQIACRWLSQLLESCIYLQEKGIMHRDIKLANILLTSKDDQNSDIRVADFGFARFLNENSFAATQLGTPLFMAPEIFNNEHYSYKADVWSLGVLTYEILTGGPVFICRTLAQLKKLQQEQIIFPEHLSENAKSLIRNMLTYDHNTRPSFQQLRGHAFFRPIYNINEIPADSIAASPQVHMDDAEDNFYEVLGNKSTNEIKEEVEEEKYYPDEQSVVKNEIQLGVLDTKTMDLDCKVEHINDIINQFAKVKKLVVKNPVIKFCNEKIVGIFQEAERIVCDYSLTRSKDLLFSELYEKIQSMLIESNDAVERIKKKVDYVKFFLEVEGEVKKVEKDLDGVKKALNLLEIAVERPECPEVLKQQQHDMLVLYKDLIRREYY
ncbi:hypothetical protein SteCoe_37314 [Stentor coeruleus]|uniref:Protein kinase domain-containing protein n=1 Tax=Stentor coeruleus TaxID=5963 RepID=A0A1R2ANB3_9CILI|nr:hypothetical protein SteCoe_37314 [Stentor coeruleus]